MKILLTGKNGQVGFELQRALAPLGEIAAVDHRECDLSNPDALCQVLTDLKPQVIINPAAYTAVDKAESEPALAHAVNAVAPGILGEAAARFAALVIHYSTDYVFDGQKEGAYCEDDIPNPQSVYGRSKLAGEQALQASGADHLIFRTSWVFGAHGGNFAKTMLRLAAERDSLNIVADQFGARHRADIRAVPTSGPGRLSVRSLSPGSRRLHQLARIRPDRHPRCPSRRPVAQAECRRPTAHCYPRLPAARAASCQLPPRYRQASPEFWPDAAGLATRVGPHAATNTVIEGGLHA